MASYKALQNKAFHLGSRVFYVSINGEQYTSNGHILAQGLIDNDELKLLKSQYDMRDTPLPILNKELLESFEAPRGESVHPKQYFEPVSGMVCMEVDGRFYQEVYIEYLMAKYDVEGFALSPMNNLIAFNERGDTVGVVAPMVAKQQEDDRKIEVKNEDNE